MQTPAVCMTCPSQRPQAPRFCIRPHRPRLNRAQELGDSRTQLSEILVCFMWSLRDTREGHNRALGRPQGIITELWLACQLEGLHANDLADVVATPGHAWKRRGQRAAMPRLALSYHAGRRVGSRAQGAGEPWGRLGKFRECWGLLGYLPPFNCPRLNNLLRRGPARCAPAYCLYFDQSPK